MWGFLIYNIFICMDLINESNRIKTLMGINEMSRVRDGREYIKNANELFTILFRDNPNWQREQPIPQLNNNRIKFDCINFQDGVAIEYQGNHHYQVVSNIIRDNRKQEMAESVGIKVIQHPYWLGIHPEYINELFGETVVDNLPHIPAGFISPSAVLPADFCEMGINRFEKEINDIPTHIKDEIIESLQIKLDTKGDINLVLPTKLRYLLE